ncbi:hypothetical protein [Winogradskyella vincentii]|uniref:Uncharacterized protein n=1 Tax=Winogradskyella vincentii TaxID=2877122 RepID=A0ABS7XZH1_9FLAO|nr:hypothetical protein [Winogradskyella vincentii]MCA0153049.1 hypothetical protein [Winogradskyella vincentii]
MKYIRSIFKTVKQESPILYYIVLILFTGGLLCIPAMFIDNREIMGINAWVKPFKFFVSTAIYTLTVGFLITFYPFSNLKKHIIRNLVSWTMLLEMVIVTYQAGRGVQSHFNFSSEFNGALFGVMGILVAINVVVMVFFAFETIRLKLKLAKAIQYAILLGWLITIFGSWVGGQMIAQMSHNVGIPDGGEGLPLLNWSTIAGDLRVAHFFGLHSIQIVPLFAWILHKKWAERTNVHVYIISIFALVFASFIFYTFYQASQGLPFMRM